MSKVKNYNVSTDKNSINIINKLNEIIKVISGTSLNHHIEFINDEFVHYYFNDKRLTFYSFEIVNILDKAFSSSSIRINGGRLEFIVEKYIGLTTGATYYSLTLINNNNAIFQVLYQKSGDNLYAIESIKEATIKIVAKMAINEDNNFRLYDRDAILGGITRLMMRKPNLEYNKNVANKIIRDELKYNLHCIDIFDGVIYYYMLLDTQIKPLLRRIFRNTDINVSLKDIKVYNSTNKESLLNAIQRGNTFYWGMNTNTVDSLISCLRAIPKEIINIPYKRENNTVRSIIFNFGTYRDGYYIIDIIFLIRNASDSIFRLEYKSCALFNKDFKLENVKAYKSNEVNNGYSINIEVHLV